MEYNKVEKDDFSERIRKLLMREKNIDIDNIDNTEMSEDRDIYNLENIIGSVNLTEGRFRTKKEANIIVDRFLSLALP